MIPMVLVERHLLEKAAEALRETSSGSDVLAEISRALNRDEARRSAAKEAGSDWETRMREARESREV